MFSACPCGFQSVSVGGLVTANFPWVWMCLSVVASSRMYSHLTDRAPRIDYRIERLLKINERMTIKAKWHPNHGITFILIVNVFKKLYTPFLFDVFLHSRHFSDAPWLSRRACKAAKLQSCSDTPLLWTSSYGLTQDCSYSFPLSLSLCLRWNFCFKQKKGGPNSPLHNDGGFWRLPERFTSL